MATTEELLKQVLDKVNKEFPENVTLQKKCDELVDHGNEKLQQGLQRLEVFINVNTFFAGLLLFGLTGTRRDGGTNYTQNEKLVIQYQILDFCIFFGAIVYAFFFIQFTKFRKWKNYGERKCMIFCDFKGLNRDQMVVYEQNPVYDPTNNVHKAIYAEADKVDKRHDHLRWYATNFTLYLTLAAIGLLLFVVLKGAAVQLGDTTTSDSVSGLDTWVLVLSIFLAVFPMFLSSSIILYYTERLYDLIEPHSMCSCIRDNSDN